MPEANVAARSRGDSSFGGGGQATQSNFLSCVGPASSLRRSCASEGSRPAPRDPAASAQGPRRTLLRPWAQIAAKNGVSLGATAAVSEGAASSRDAGFRRWQPSDSRNKALERQPASSLRKSCATGGSRCRHRPRRQLFRRWRPGDSKQLSLLCRPGVPPSKEQRLGRESPCATRSGG